jgi:predicted nucleotidyltransferase
MATTSDMTAEAMALYRATMRQRGEREQKARRQRREGAWQIAKRAAALLKEEFGATQVVLFGSLAHGYWFSPTSDIDLAAWGLESDSYFTAVARLQELSPEFKVDLVDMESCQKGLREAILKDGKSL